MKESEYVEMVTKDFEQKTAMHKKKSHDYADEDALSNFKRVSAICKLLRVDVGTPSGAALFHLIHKMDRIQNLLAKKVKPENESLKDNLLDAQIYLDLYKANLIDEGKVE